MTGKLIHRDMQIPFNQLKDYLPSLDSGKTEAWEKDVFGFLKDWLSGKEYFELQTSGTTGSPKKIQVSRKDMLLSAGFTLKYLSLNAQDTALLCLPVKFVAGKMMLVRALLGNMNLSMVEPSHDPLPSVVEKVDFIAITPHQLRHILRNRESASKLAKISRVIVGGGKIEKDLTEQVSTWENMVFSTYGMTETLSHIAMARVNSTDSNIYTLINDAFKIKLDDRACLHIASPYRHMPEVRTNDLVQLDGKSSFIWKGRYDNVINSGGIKFSPEEIEHAIQELIDEPFIISSSKDVEFGEKLVLIIESDNKNKYLTKNFLLHMADTLNNPYAVPKEVILLERLAYTENDKINRSATQKLIE